MDSDYDLNSFYHFIAKLFSMKVTECLRKSLNVSETLFHYLKNKIIICAWYCWLHP